MRAYSLTHLGDAVLTRELAAVVAHERTATAAVLAHLAEFDARRLYLPAGYPSMVAYCVYELHLSEDSAYKRIHAARAARQFPALYTAVAEGRLHLTGAGLLAPHLTAENADELLAAAAYRTKAEIELLLARRFPRSELLALVQPLPPCGPPPDQALAPAQVGADEPPEHAGLLTGELAPAQVEAAEPRAKVVPLAPQRFALQFTIGQETYDRLQYAQALLSHVVPAGELAEVFDRALRALIPQLERQTFAGTGRPRPDRPRPTANPRSIPAPVQRAVWQRDGGQCTFVGTTGQRCPARRFLQFDHILPVARGGPATVDNLRIRCASHNALEADRTFGAEFMAGKREEARRAADARARAAAAGARAAAQAQARDVMAGLRELGFRADQARRAAEFAETLPDATLEERMRAALKFLCPRTRSQGRFESSAAAPT